MKTAGSRVLVAPGARAQALAAFTVATGGRAKLPQRRSARDNSVFSAASRRL